MSDPAPPNAMEADVAPMAGEAGEAESEDEVEDVAGMVTGGSPEHLDQRHLIVPPFSAGNTAPANTSAPAPLEWPSSSGGRYCGGSANICLDGPFSWPEAPRA
jgi:hypothetical protein